MRTRKSKQECIVNEVVNRFILKELIGKGAYGAVYVGAELSNSERPIAFKRFYKTLHPKLIQMELQIINFISGIDSTNSFCKFQSGFTFDSSNESEINNFNLPLNELAEIDKKKKRKVQHQKEVFLMFNYFEHDKFYSYFTTITLKQMKKYLHDLFTAINKLWENGIVHRDIKPDNFLFNTKSCESQLIDFVLAELTPEYVDDFSKQFKKMDSSLKTDELKSKYQFISEHYKLQKHLKIHNRIGTRGFLAPEILFHYQMQTTKVDIWSAGCIFMSFLTRKMQFFYMNHSLTNADDVIKELIPMINVFGHTKIMEVSNKCNVALYIPEKFSRNQIKGGLMNMELYKREDMLEIIEEGGLDLLEKCLEPDFDKRIEAKDALKHRFFDSLKDK